MVKEVIARCDRCGATEGVREFTITLEGVTKDVDLCGEHGAPVIEVFELGAEDQPKPKQRRGRSAHSVVPIEEWEGPVK